MFYTCKNKDMMDNEFKILESRYNNVLENINHIEGDIVCLDECKNTLDRYGLLNEGDINKKINDLIESNRVELDVLRKSMRCVLDEISDYRNKCIHDRVYVGHDSHYDYYKCSKCGFVDRT